MSVKQLRDALQALYDATPDNEGGALGKACQLARAALAEERSDSGEAVAHELVKWPDRAGKTQRTPMRRCPFCGGLPSITLAVNGTQMFYVSCQCGIEFKAAWYRGDVAPTRDIIAVWNTRSVLPPVALPVVAREAVLHSQGVWDTDERCYIAETFAREDLDVTDVYAYVIRADAITIADTLSSRAAAPEPRRSSGASASDVPASIRDERGGSPLAAPALPSAAAPETNSE